MLVYYDYVLHNLINKSKQGNTSQNSIIIQCVIINSNLFYQVRTPCRGLGSVVVTYEQAKNNNSLLKTSEGEELINTHEGHRQWHLNFRQLVFNVSQRDKHVKDFKQKRQSLERERERNGSFLMILARITKFQDCRLVLNTLPEIFVPLWNKQERARQMPPHYHAKRLYTHFA